MCVLYMCMPLRTQFMYTCMTSLEIRVQHSASYFHYLSIFLSILLLRMDLVFPYSARPEVQQILGACLSLLTSNTCTVLRLQACIIWIFIDAQYQKPGHHV